MILTYKKPKVETYFDFLNYKLNLSNLEEVKNISKKIFN